MNIFKSSLAMLARRKEMEEKDIKMRAEEKKRKEEERKAYWKEQERIKEEKINEISSLWPYSSREVFVIEKADSGIRKVKLAQILYDSERDCYRLLLCSNSPVVPRDCIFFDVFLKPSGLIAESKEGKFYRISKDELNLDVSWVICDELSTNNNSLTDVLSIINGNEFRGIKPSDYTDDKDIMDLVHKYEFVFESNTVVSKDIRSMKGLLDTIFKEIKELLDKIIKGLLEESPFDNYNDAFKYFNSLKEMDTLRIDVSSIEKLDYQHTRVGYNIYLENKVAPNNFDKKYETFFENLLRNINRDYYRENDYCQFFIDVDMENKTIESIKLRDVLFTRYNG